MIEQKQVKTFNQKWLVLIGACYGLVMRLLFGLGFVPFYYSHHTDSSPAGPMLASFAMLVPAIIGAMTYYYTSEDKRTFVGGLFAGYIPTILFVVGTGLLLIEGSICIAMALPLFLIMSSVGGFLMWAVLKIKTPSGTTVNSMLFLPLLLAPIESNVGLPNYHGLTKESVVIHAPPERVWHLINYAVNIQPEEMDSGLVYKIGVPLPKEAITVNTQEGRIRKLKWDKQVAFDEPITDWQENRYIKWGYRFTPNSFPEHALDEHVVIGGKYFDLLDTSYKLTPIGDDTRLDIEVNYRISTSFNWYATYLGNVLVSDSAHQILTFYRTRAELSHG